jgi:hypothetical protein
LAQIGKKKKSGKMGLSWGSARFWFALSEPAAPDERLAEDAAVENFSSTAWGNNPQQARSGPAIIGIQERERAQQAPNRT